MPKLSEHYKIWFLVPEKQDMTEISCEKEFHLINFIFTNLILQNEKFLNFFQNIFLPPTI